MAIANTEKSLTIRRNFYEGVTGVPHFPVEIHYVGHHVVVEDIYFDKPEQFIKELQALEVSREGEILLDGGMRLKISFKANSHGGIVVSFHSEEFEPSFPGQCILDGYFLVEGEYVGQLVSSFEKLFSDGTSVFVRYSV
jgi:hypothetical protein